MLMRRLLMRFLCILGLHWWEPFCKEGHMVIEFCESCNDVREVPYLGSSLQRRKDKLDETTRDKGAQR